MADSFERVRAAALPLPNVRLATKYDGSPVLRRDGAFMAGLATHPSAEPGTLVVRSTFEERERLLEEAPATYYVTDYYLPHPVVLARLSQLDNGALRDLLAMSWRRTADKVRRGRTPARK